MVRHIHPDSSLRMIDPHACPTTTLLLFGATGDLAQRYLFPSLLRLHADGLLPAGLRIRGLALSAHDDAGFADLLRQRLLEAAPDAQAAAAIEGLLARVQYRSVDLSDSAAVTAAVADVGGGTCLSYLSIPPALYPSTAQGLAQAGALAAPSRLMLEKPIGSDGASADALLEQIAGLIEEERTYRVDHYLGKAAVQNLMALRFGNTLLEAVWNRNHIESVHILVAESGGVDGRSAYYAQAGALRDMVQSHILQLLALVAMEPPVSLQADRIRDEKVKVLRSLRPLDPKTAAPLTLRARYGAGRIDGQDVPGYVPPAGTDPETFAAVTAHIDNWRWAGVPFHLVTGKRLPCRSTQVVITLKPVSHWLFDKPSRGQAQPNRITLQLQPNENIQLGLLSSLAGPEWGALELQPLALELSVPTGQQRRIAYERLFLDALSGNSALFVRADEVRAAWAWTDSVLAAWQQAGLAMGSYPAGQWGPQRAAQFLPANLLEPSLP